MVADDESMININQSMININESMIEINESMIMSVCIMYVCRMYILDVCVFDDCVAVVGVQHLCVFNAQISNVCLQFVSPGFLRWMNVYWITVWRMSECWMPKFRMYGCIMVG